MALEAGTARRRILALVSSLCSCVKALVASRKSPKREVKTESWVESQLLQKLKKVLFFAIGPFEGSS